MAKNKKSKTTVPTNYHTEEISEGERIWLEMQEQDRLEREETGREFQKDREAAELTRNAMARLAGISGSTLKRFEEGKYILRTPLVEKSLTNALEMERLRRVFAVLVSQLPFALRNLSSNRERFR